MHVKQNMRIQLKYNNDYYEKKKSKISRYNKKKEKHIPSSGLDPVWIISGRDPSPLTCAARYRLRFSIVF